METANIPLPPPDEIRKETEKEEMTRKLEEREKKIEELQRELKRARSGEKEKKIEELQRKLESARSGEKEKIEELQRKLERARSGEKEKIEELQRKLERARSGEKEKIEELQRKLERARSGEKEKKIEELEKELESARSGEKEKKIEELERNLESARSGEKEKKIEELEKELESARSEEKEKKIEELERNLESARSGEKEKKIEELEKELESARSGEKEKKIEELEKELESARSGEKEKKIEELEKELESARSGEKEKKIEELEKELESARARERKKKEEEEDVYVPITDVLKMQKEITQMKAEKKADDVKINQYKRQFQFVNVERDKMQNAVKRLRDTVTGNHNDRWMTSDDQLKYMEQVRTSYIQMTKDSRHCEDACSCFFEKQLETPISEVFRVELQLAQERATVLERVIENSGNPYYHVSGEVYEIKLKKQMEIMKRAVDDFIGAHSKMRLINDLTTVQRKMERMEKVWNSKELIYQNKLKMAQEKAETNWKEAREKTGGLEKKLETSRLEYQKNLQEAQEKIAKLEEITQMSERRICDCVTNEKEAVDSSDIGEELQKMREVIRKNEEGMTKLKDVIIGEKSMERVEECTVNGGHGLLQKIKSLEELCCSKDSVISAMKEQLTITEYEMFQLREIALLNNQYPELEENRLNRRHGCSEESEMSVPLLTMENRDILAAQDNMLSSTIHSSVSPKIGEKRKSN